MALPAGGLLGDNLDDDPRQAYAIGGDFVPFECFNAQTPIVDDVTTDIHTGSIGIVASAQGQTNRYRLNAQIQLVFPRSNSKLHVAFFRDDIQVSDGIVIETNGTFHMEELIANSFTWVNLRAKNYASADDFGAQDNIQPVIQSIRFHIEGR